MGGNQAAGDNAFSSQNGSNAAPPVLAPAPAPPLAPAPVLPPSSATPHSVRTTPSSLNSVSQGMDDLGASFDDDRSRDSSPAPGTPPIVGVVVPVRPVVMALTSIFNLLLYMADTFTPQMMGEPLFTEDGKTFPTIPDIPCAVCNINREDGLTPDQMLELWVTAEDWLFRRGVQLYGLEPPPGWVCRFWHTPLMGTAATLPYAHRIWHEGMLSKTFRTKTQIACGQDLDGRDIILKLVDNGSVEHRIYQTLLQHKSLFADLRTFPGVLPPITIIDTPHKYSVVTMPLWGTNLYIKDMQDVRQVLTFIRCLLEGLSFLHANRIVHRDIFDSNIIVSCYRPDRDHEKFRDDLRELRRGDDVRYAFMDYDQSIQLPLDVSLKDYRCPSTEAWMGSDLYKPLDVWLGETQYNPFAFDVGTLGNLFRVYFWEAVPIVPALAPLFDGMTTHVVSRRFTAQEALDFFKSHVESPPQDVLDTPVTLQVDYETMIKPELYWSKLAPVVQAHWSQFREPPLPRWWHLLNWLMGTVPGCARFVEFVWRIFGI
ncbi:hypothetical protein V8D89_003247 [Ganoderma adspersum]